MLVLTRKADQGVVIEVGGRRVHMVVQKMTDVRVKLLFEAPDDVRIMREETEEARCPSATATTQM